MCRLSGRPHSQPSVISERFDFTPQQIEFPNQMALLGNEVGAFQVGAMGRRYDCAGRHPYARTDPGGRCIPLLASSIALP